MAKAENKTKAQPDNKPAAYFAAIEDPARRADCLALDALMRKATGCPSVMWGTAIVGYDQYHYRYESGREGDMCVVGFSSRKGDISVYLTCNDEGATSQALLAKLGPHKMGKACLYIKRMADVDAKVLSELVKVSVKATKARYPGLEKKTA